MEFFKHNTNIDFMGQRKWAAMLSIALFVLSIAALAIHGLNWGLDFTGGTQIQLSYPQAANLDAIHDQLAKVGFGDATVVSYGTSKDVLVTLVPKASDAAAGATQGTTDASNNVNSPTQDEQQTLLVKKVMAVLPDAKFEQASFIGPQVGEEMASKGLIAVIVSLLGTMIYIALRFDMRFAIGSTIALVHDPIIILGIFSFMHVEFNLIALAAVLTVIGYSLNDTIVIFDRVRENFRKMRKADAVTVMNQSINQTLSRTIMTSALTAMVVLALFFLGGSLLYGFSLALLIGIIVGTYSSIYVAGSLTLALGLDRKHLIPHQKTVDESP